MDAAFCSARRVTLGWIDHTGLNQVAELTVSALKPKFSSFESRTRPTTTRLRARRFGQSAAWVLRGHALRYSRRLLHRRGA